MTVEDAERRRLREDAAREHHWKRWGPYLSERQWGTVREDYSAGGDAWNYFPHEHARSRAYRWGEDGLLGLTDREGRLCFALALWNGRDPFLKERLFGLANGEGNHGEDVKECYYYLDSTPTHTYMKALYKYPQREFPYARLVAENGRRTRDDAEFELEDTGVFDGDRYFDVTVEYANATPNDVLIRLSVANRGDEPARLHLLPTVWFRNTWAWGRTGEGYWPRPSIKLDAGDDSLSLDHASLGRLRFAAEPAGDGTPREWLFTENETNAERLYNSPNRAPYVKDAFHEYVVAGRAGAVNPAREGTKAAAYYRLEVPAGGEVTLRLRLTHDDERTDAAAFGDSFDETFAARRAEADEFYDSLIPRSHAPRARRVMRQAYAGLLWSKQFYHYVVAHWLAGDPAYPPPPRERLQGRNFDWQHLYNRDVVSMPDKWEYPWYAAWDLAFHMIPFARVDPQFAKDQLVLFLREWYMHPSGKLPSYEWTFNDANPPVHAWACWRVYRMGCEEGKPDRSFLERVFPKLLVNFTHWVNRQDVAGRNLFAGGFLGLDNIGLFDRSQPLPGGGVLQQADGTAWMAFYCSVMLQMSLELARAEPEYEDIASKFFEDFVGIVDAINALGESGLWCEEDGFYYDEIKTGDGRQLPLRVRSLVGLIPLIAVVHLDEDLIAHLPGFAKRLRWFLENRQDLARHISYVETSGAGRARGLRLLAIPSRERLAKVLGHMLDEREFLSPHGVRSLSRAYADRPYVLRVEGHEYKIAYDPADSTSDFFGGNSNWRGPVWFPVNYLLVEALGRYHKFYGDEFKIECPTGSGRLMNLAEVAAELTRRLTSIFVAGADAHGGDAPWHGGDVRYSSDPHWRDLTLFHEYFHGDTGRGVGASHQTGWTALVATLLERLGRDGAE